MQDLGGWLHTQRLEQDKNKTVWQSDHTTNLSWQTIETDSCLHWCILGYDSRQLWKWSVTKGRWNDCCLKAMKVKHVTNKYKKRSVWKCGFTLKFSLILMTVRGWIRWDCLWLHYQCLKRSHRASIHWAREDGITLSCCSSLSFSSAATEGSCSAEVEVGTMTVLGLFPASRSW